MNKSKFTEFFTVSALLLMFAVIGICGFAEEEEKGPMGPFGPVPASAGNSLNYWAWQDLPDITNEQLMEYISMIQAKGRDYYKELLVDGMELSKKLEGYIRKWLDGKADALIPKGFLPPSIDGVKMKNWRLLKPDEVKPEEQWLLRPAEQPNEKFKNLRCNNADCNATYNTLFYIAPFGTELLIEGEFPHARFMSYQASGPYDPVHPYSGNVGVMEVPIVDVDIEPEPGHTNPFRNGADRTAEKRSYRVSFELDYGNMVKSNPGLFVNEHFRAPGNSRVAGPFSCSGPLGRGAIIPGVIWQRYYACDKDKGPLGGVPVPKALLKLPTGEKFWIQPDMTVLKKLKLFHYSGFKSKPREPFSFVGKDFGWFKMFDICELHLQGKTLLKVWNKPKEEQERQKKQLRRFMLAVGKGENVTPPGNIGHSATDCPYNTYICRPMILGAGKLIVITGKLPTTPATRNGEKTMEKAECRYWSLSHSGNGEKRRFNKIVFGTIMDDEVTVSENQEYIIVLSRLEDRPENAKPECGVTWQDFGPCSIQGCVMRMMRVYPDQFMEEYIPDDARLPWCFGSWSSKDYNPVHVGLNKPGVMGRIIL